MTQQEATRLAGRIAREMPAVQTTLKEHQGRKNATPWWSVQAQHTKLHRTLPILDRESWQLIKDTWIVLEQEGKIA